MKLAISRVHYPVTTLGPGRRVGIWFQGCSIKCPGCVSADTWGAKKPGVHISDLLAGIRGWLKACDGVTISGGEPFDQPEALAELLAGVREYAATVLVYSGYPYERLQGFAGIGSRLIDALISDPFLLEESQTRALRGSDNQRLHLLTAQGREAFGPFDRPALESEKRLDVMFDALGAVWFAGIPRRGDMQRLQSILAADGHWAKTTEAGQ